MKLQHLQRHVALLVVVGSVSGCTPERGSVAIDIQAMALDARTTTYEVRVAGPDNEVIFTQAMGAGQSFSRGNVPLGWVSISAGPACTVSTELTSEHLTMRLIVDGKRCTLAD